MDDGPAPRNCRRKTRHHPYFDQAVGIGASVVGGGSAGFAGLSKSGAKCRHQQVMYIIIESTSTTITQRTTRRSIQDPNGGALGSALRSGTTANSIAAYQVVIGGWNFRRSRAV